MPGRTPDDALARELARVRWALHCRLHRLEALEAELRFATVEVAELRRREHELVDALIDRPDLLEAASQGCGRWRR